MPRFQLVSEPNLYARLHDITYRRKLDLKLAMNDARQKLQKITSQLDVELAKGDAMSLSVAQGLSIDSEIIRESDINLTYLHHVLIQVVDVNDKELYDANKLISDAPEHVTLEVINLCQAFVQMLPEERKNFKWPTTSGAAVDGQSLNTNAPSAIGKDSGDGATVVSITQST